MTVVSLPPYWELGMSSSIPILVCNKYCRVPHLLSLQQHIHLSLCITVTICALREGHSSFAWRKSLDGVCARRINLVKTHPDTIHCKWVLYLCLVPHPGPGPYTDYLGYEFGRISRLPWIRKCVVGTVIYGTFGRLDLGLRSTSDPWKLHNYTGLSHLINSVDRFHFDIWEAIYGL